MCRASRISLVLIVEIGHSKSVLHPGLQPCLAELQPIEVIPSYVDSEGFMPPVLSDICVDRTYVLNNIRAFVTLCKRVPSSAFHRTNSITDF